MADPIGAKLTVDISEVKSRILEANKLIKENERQWRVNASTMDDWTKSEKGLSDRMDSLSRDIKTYQDNIKDLTEQKEKAVKQYGEESVEVKELNRLLDSQLRALEKSKREYKQVSSSLDKLQSSTDKAGKETEDITSESKKASKALDNLEKEAKETGDGFTIAKGAIAGFIANGLSSIVSMAGNAVSSLMGLTEATLEYRREMARVTTVAEQVGVSGDRIIDKWIDMNAVIQDESSVTEGLNNLMSAGYTTEKELDGITRALEGASIQWAETLKFEGLSDSLQEWIGSNGASLTGQFAELLERLGYDLEKVTAQTQGMSDAQRRNWAIQILNKNGLGDVSDAYREANSEMIDYNKANADLLHAQSQLGESMQPFVTTVKQSTADILYSFMDMLEGVEGADEALMDNVSTLVENVVSSVSSVVSKMMPVIAGFIPKVLAKISENLPSFLEQGIAMVTNIIEGVAQKIPDVISKVSEMVFDIVGYVAESGPSLFSAAIELFGNIVLAIPEFLDQLMTELPTIITTIMDGIYDGEDSIYSTAMDVLNKIVEAIPSTISNLASKLPDIINAILDSLKNNGPTVLAGAKNLFLNIVNAIPKIMGELAKALVQIPTTIVNYFKDEGNRQAFIQIGKDIIRGLIKGLLSMGEALWQGLKNVGNAIIDGFKSFFGIASPSKVMAEQGQYLTEGVAEGIEDGAPDAEDAMDAVGSGILGTFSKTFNAAGVVVSTGVGLINSTLKKIINSPVIRPVVEWASDSVVEFIDACKTGDWSKIFEGINTGISLFVGLRLGATAIADFTKNLLSGLSSGLPTFSKATAGALGLGAITIGAKIATAMDEGDWGGFAQDIIAGAIAGLAVGGITGSVKNGAIVFSIVANLGLGSAAAEGLGGVVNNIIEGELDAQAKRFQEELDEVVEATFKNTGYTAIQQLFAILNTAPYDTMAYTISDQLNLGLREGLDWSKIGEEEAQYFLDALTGKLEIHSPSKAMERIGQFVTDGFREGVSIDEFKQLGNDIVSAFDEGLLGFTDAISILTDATSQYYEKGEEISYSVADGFVSGIETSREDMGKAVEDAVMDALNQGADAVEGAQLPSIEIPTPTWDTSTVEDVEVPIPVPTVDTSNVVNIDDSDLKAVAGDDGGSAKDAIPSVLETTKDNYQKEIQNVLGSLFGGDFGGIADYLLNSFAKTGAAGSIISGFLGFLVDAIEQGEEEGITMEEVATAMVDQFTAMLENLPAIARGAIEFLSALATGLMKGIPVLIRMLPELVATMVQSLLEDGIPALFEVGIELVKGLIQGMFSIDLWGFISSIGTGIVNGFKKLFGIKSPSRVMADVVGKNLALGIAEGIDDNLYSVNDALRDGVDTSLEMDGIQRKQVNVYQTNNYAQAHSRYELYKSKHDTANAVRLAMQGV